MKELSDIERLAALLAAVDLWNPGRIGEKIASHLNMRPGAVERLLASPKFQEEVARQRDGSESDFTIADRRTRVSDLQSLFSIVPARRVGLKIKLLTAISKEVGDSRL